jgi:hypothetical protein
MDSDDISEPMRLAKQATYLMVHREVGVVGSSVQLIDERHKKIGIKVMPLDTKEIKRLLPKRNPLIHPTVMIDRSLFHKLGGYDRTLEGAEDYDLWLRFAQFTNLVNLPQPLLKYRIRKTAVSSAHISLIYKATVKAQLKSTLKYGYPLSNVRYTIKPFIASLLPNTLLQNWVATHPYVH